MTVVSDSDQVRESCEWNTEEQSGSPYVEDVHPGGRRSFQNIPQYLLLLLLLHLHHHNHHHHSVKNYIGKKTRTLSLLGGRGQGTATPGGGRAGGGGSG